MAYWNSRGLRGDGFEKMIDLTNESYRNHGLALVQKIPTPIVPVELDSTSGIIKKAYFEKKSTVDYIGLVQGIPICFDAKSIMGKVLPLQNIHDHQMKFMEDFKGQGGLSFFLVSLDKEDLIYLLTFEFVNECFERARKGGRKSITINEIKTNAYKISSKRGFFVHYLEGLNLYLDELDKA